MGEAKRKFRIGSFSAAGNRHQRCLQYPCGGYDGGRPLECGAPPNDSHFDSHGDGLTATKRTRAEGVLEKNLFRRHDTRRIKCVEIGFSVYQSPCLRDY
jgi:hypothetical protein